ncbi:hypothetical protein Pcinc_007692 [Petrolisthes cinctipes]|uniref:C2H2-type domain-containing protein n=1 Tax=Petrolisthes cinctipes TaxID=88211 RepID=A0AAE1KX62_PETCI|nr:hypothetical protein Pcinc_007692 [Petrolisthes cinctipes]
MQPLLESSPVTATTTTTTITTTQPQYRRTTTTTTTIPHHHHHYHNTPPPPLPQYPTTTTTTTIPYHHHHYHNTATPPLPQYRTTTTTTIPHHHHYHCNLKATSSTRTMFKCTWNGCQEMTSACDAIERHIRSTHLGREEVSSEHSDSDSDDEDDHEEEFYWTEVEVNVATWVDPCEPLVNLALPPAITTTLPTAVPAPPITTTTTITTTNKMITPTPPPPPPPVPSAPQSPGVTLTGVPALQHTQPQYIHVSSPPTLSHMDMARPPHEDPRYRQQMGGTTLSSSWPRSSTYLGSGRGKIRVSSSPKASPGRGKRNGESRKCRKVYGMEQRDLWCTQCKWKKACSRFGE